VDNSGLKITWVQPGLVSLRITVYGLPGGAWATGSTAGRETSQNAIIKMTPVIDAIEKWSEGYSKRRTYTCPGGTVIPAAHITSMEAGTPYKASMRPGVCAISVIAMVPPGLKPLEVAKEVKDVIREAGVDAEVEMYRSCLGFEAEGISGLVKVIENSYEQLFHSKLEICDPPYCSVWTDTSTYNEMGIPCVKIGVGMSAADRLTRGNDAYDEHSIDDMVKAAKLYTMIALEVCSRTALDE
jgi:acetylornithine deacetylase/succinyl-diaminopimelate desuccinylase-like protein